MSYYTEDIDRRCNYYGCKSRATVELKTSGTVGYGYYCRKHGEAEAKRRNSDETRWRNALLPTEAT